jgi:hypothetical protein
MCLYIAAACDASTSRSSRLRIEIEAVAWAARGLA